MPSSIKMNREQLVETMKKNCEKHVEIYNKAVQEYLLDLEEVSSKNHRDMKKAIAAAKASGKIDKLYTNNRSLPAAPKSYEAEYSNKIAMFTASVDPVIELDEEEFKQYVLDQWGWKQHFVATASSYMNKLPS